MNSTLLCIKVLSQRGEWLTMRQIIIPSSTRSFSLGEVLKLVIENEIMLRGNRDQEQQASGEGTLLASLLTTGGVEIPKVGALAHIPLIEEVLEHLAFCLKQHLLLVLLNGEPWREWQEARGISEQSELCFARTVWLQTTP